MNSVLNLKTLISPDSLLEGFDEPMFIKDTDRRFIAVNEAFCQFVGRPREAILGLTDADLFDPQEAEIQRRMDERALRTNASVVDEDFLHDGTGMRMFLQATRSILRTRKGDRYLVGHLKRLQDTQAADEVVRRGEVRFRALLEETPSISVQGYDRDRRVIFWNKASEKLYGFTAEEAMGKHIEELIIPGEMTPMVKMLIDDWIEKGIPIPAAEHDLLHRDGGIVPVYSSHVMLTNLNGEPELYCLDLDLTDRRASEDALKASEERLRSAQSIAKVSNWQWTFDSNRMEWSDQMFLQLGLAPDSVTPSVETLLSYVHPDDRTRVGRMFDDAPQGDGSLSHEFQLCQADGQVRTVLTLAKAMEDSAGRVVGMQGVFQDITDRRRAEQALRNAQVRLHRQANYDATTGLPNRMLANDRIAQALKHGRRDSHSVGIMFLDLDHFKRINDTYGYAFGDALLCAAAERMMTCIRREDTVARLGGDEFAIILPDLQRAADAETVACKLIDAFSKPFVLEDQEIYAPTSVGIAVYPLDGDEPAELLRNADSAMYLAKNSGRGTYRFFTSDLDRESRERARMESLLRHALDRGELNLVYQPLVSVSARSVVGVEALLRWTNPSLGAVPPDVFVPVAEDAGLIGSIGAWVLDQACDQLRGWHDAGHKDLRVSVNISGHQFRRGDLADMTSRILGDRGLPAHTLELEITESLFMDKVAEAGPQLADLRDMGVRIALDDFGTGYSSLSYLKRFPVHTLKIDRTFVRDVVTDKGDRALIGAIIAMGHSLELDIVAEGVEDAEQRDAVRAMGCDLVQGYLYSRPLPPEEMDALLAWFDEG